MGPWPTVCAMSLLRDTRAASVVGSWKRERGGEREERERERKKERKGTESFPVLVVLLLLFESEERRC